jgi:hypothetical protein
MILAVVVVVLVVAACWLALAAGHGGAAHRPGGDGTPLPPAATGAAPVPSPSVGKPAAARHDSAGAVAAAVSIVAMEPALVAGDDTAATELVASWAADSASGQLMDLVRQERSTFNQAPGGPYSFDVAPLAAKAVSSGADDVTVQLWCSEVVFAKGSPRYSAYVTEALHLVWQNGGWRLASTSDTAGPVVPLAPGKAATTIEDAAGRLAGFAPVGLLEKGS